jgi:hypothetical protein
VHRRKTPSNAQVEDPETLTKSGNGNPVENDGSKREGCDDQQEAARIIETIGRRILDDAITLLREVGYRPIKTSSYPIVLLAPSPPFRRTFSNVSELARFARDIAWTVPPTKR